MPLISPIYESTNRTPTFSDAAFQLNQVNKIIERSDEDVKLIDEQMENIEKVKAKKWLVVVGTLLFLCLGGRTNQVPTI